MSLIPPSDLPKLYATLMDEIKLRILGINHLMQLIADRRDQREAFVFLEGAYVQIRKICEIVAIAVLVAHNHMPQVRTKKFLREWNADAIFGMLGKLNPECFPRRMTEGAENAAATHTIQTHGFLTRSGLKKIYMEVGKRLHVGDLDTLMKVDRHYDVDEARQWVQQIIDVLRHHIVVIPSLGAAMITVMSRAPDGLVACSLWSVSNSQDDRSMLDTTCLYTATSSVCPTPNPPPPSETPER